MGLWSRLTAAAAAFVEKDASGAAALPSQGFLPTLGSTPSATGLLISQGTAMAVSAVYACVDRRAKDVARCTPRLMEPQGDGSYKQVINHPVARFLKRPNDYQTWYEWMQQQQGAYLLRGNAYAAIRRDGRGSLRDMIPVNPDAVLVLESWDGAVFYNVNRIGLWQIAMLREFPSSIAAEDILHVRGISFNSLVALSPIGMARDSIGVAMGLEQQSARWIGNGARPSIVLQSKKPLTEATAKRLKKQFEDANAGIQNTARTTVLEDGIEAKQLQLTSIDLEMMAQRNFQVAEIARLFGVPPHKLGTEAMRGVNLVQMDQDYVSNTIMPDIEMWEQKFGMELDLDRQGLVVKLDETRLLRADVTTRANVARIWKLSGITTTNEIRVGEGLPPVPGGDEVMQPLNMAPLGSAVDGVAPDGAGRPPAGELPPGSTVGVGPIRETEDGAPDKHAHPAHYVRQTNGHAHGEDAGAFLLAMQTGSRAASAASGRRRGGFSVSTRAGAAEKFARVAELDRKFESIVKENDAARQSSDPATVDKADCVNLIMKMGIRPGSPADTGAEKQAFGKHVAQILGNTPTVVGNALPMAHFGTAETPLPDWRDGPDEIDPDDEQMDTPSDVVEMLGFDPADEDSESVN